MTDAAHEALVASDDHDGASIFGRRFRDLTVGIVSILVLVAFEGLAMTTVMPVAVRELHGTNWYSATFGTYLATSVLAMVIAGDIADRRGPVGPLVAGIGGFAAGLAVSATAPGIATFLVGRALTGLGAGLIIVPLYAIVGSHYPAALQPRIMAAMGSAWVVPSIAGPACAGFIVQTVGWRWAFYVALIFIVPAATFLWRPLVRLRQISVSAEAGTRWNRSRVGWAAITAGGLGALQIAGQSLSVVNGAVLGAALVLIAVGAVHLLPAGSLSGRVGLPRLILLRGLLAGAFFGSEAFIPLMLIEQRGTSAGFAGVAISAGAATWALGSWWQGRHPSTRLRLIRVGASLIALGIALLIGTSWSSVPPTFVPIAWLVSGLGIGLSLTCVNVEALGLAPERDKGVTAAALQISDSILSVTTIAVIGALVTSLRPTIGPIAFAIAFSFTCGIAAFAAVLARRARSTMTS